MNDHGNSHGEGGGVPPATPPLDMTRTVFSVEVAYRVTAKLFILAHNEDEALRLAEAKDLDDLIGFDESQVWIDFDDRLEFDDVTPSLTGAVNRSPADPKNHPDWNPEPRL